jgi:hypothetical protein
MSEPSQEKAIYTWPKLAEQAWTRTAPVKNAALPGLRSPTCTTEVVVRCRADGDYVRRRRGLLKSDSPGWPVRDRQIWLSRRHLPVHAGRTPGNLASRPLIESRLCLRHR